MTAELTPAMVRDIPRMYPHTYAAQASGGAFKPYPHLAHVGRIIAQAANRGGARIIINMPPAHGKSELTSHWTPTWYLDNFPERRVMMATHTSKLSSRWGREVRDEFRGNPYTRSTLAPDREATDQWNTPQGGGMISAGIGSALSGFHFNLGIIDDVINSWAQAYSFSYRKMVRDWFDSVFYQRRLKGASIVVLMTRWHRQDLVGYLTKDHPDDWTVIRLPGIAEPDDPLGRQPGEALCPDLKSVEDMRADAGNKAVMAALIQQDPAGLGDSRVYDQFSEAHNEADVTLSDALPLQIGIDFNVNPGIHVSIGQYDPSGNTLGFDRDVFVTRHIIHGPRMDTRGAMKALAEWIEQQGGFRWPNLEVYGDQTGNNSTSISTESGYDIVENALISMRVPYEFVLPSRNPPIRDRIDAVNDALCDIDDHHHYIIDPSCTSLLTDMNDLPKGDDGLIDKSKRSLSHASDADGYRIWYQRPIIRPDTSDGPAFGVVG